MRFEVRFVVGALVALFLGASIGLALNASQYAAVGVPESPDEDPGFRVPNGHVGDQASYSLFTKHDGAQWEEGGSRTLVVHALESSLNETRTPRDAVVLLWAPGNGHIRPFRTYVDLATREVARADMRIEIPGALDVYTDFGPRLDAEFLQDYAARWGDSRDASWSDRYDLALVRFQGRTLTVGQDLIDETRSAFTREWGLDVDGARLVSFQSQVTRAGTIEGRRAFEIRTNGTIQFDLPKWSDWDRDSGRALLSMRVPLESRPSFDQRVWVTESSPYPILIQEQIRVGNKLLQSTGSLDVLKPGNRPIPWTSTQAAPPSLKLERSPAAQHSPADGTGSGLQYLLSEAMAGALADPTLVRFESWKLQRPQIFLVGASYEVCGEASSCDAEARSAIWHLLWAAPDGSAFYIQSTKDLMRLSTTNQEMGELTVFAFDPKELPSGLMTIAEAERAWAELSIHPSAAHGVPFLFWGVAPYALFSTQYLPNAGFAERPALADLRNLTIGYQPLGVNVSEMSDDDFNESFVRFDVQKGELVWADTYGFKEIPQVDWPQAEGVLPSEPKSLPDQKAAAVPPAPDLAIVTAASASLLLVFLTVYFYPALKFFVAKPYAFLPGFARIRGQDVLKNRIREEVLQVISADPGIDASQVGRRVDAGWSTVVYHLSVLERNKIVSSIVDGRHRRFFPAATIGRGDRERIAVLQNTRTRALLGMIQAEPGAVRKGLAKRLGISRPALAWHLQRLERTGQVSHETKSRRMRYFATTRPVPSQTALLEVTLNAV